MIGHRAPNWFGGGAWGRSASRAHRSASRAIKRDEREQLLSELAREAIEDAAITPAGSPRPYHVRVFTPDHDIVFGDELDADDDQAFGDPTSEDALFEYYGVATYEDLLDAIEAERPVTDDDLLACSGVWGDTIDATDLSHGFTVTNRPYLWTTDVSRRRPQD